MDNNNFERCWIELREFLKDYREEKQKVWLDEGEYERYCVALSIDDILKKMDEIEEK